MSVQALNLDTFQNRPRRWPASRRLTVTEYLALSTRSGDQILPGGQVISSYELQRRRIELIEGELVERMAANMEHEMLFAWMLTLCNLYAQDHKLGRVLGSRSFVEIDEYHGRLPDLLFVREERLHILQYMSVVEAPDLIVELVSPGDTAADVAALVKDYTGIGVLEIVFIDRQKKSVRILRKRNVEYEDTELLDEELALESLPGLRIDLDWLFLEPRPDIRQALDQIAAKS